MDRKELERHIAEVYGTVADYPWNSAPRYAVFRHRENRKWFAVIMDLSPDKLGLAGEGMLDVVNLKCDPLLAGSLRENPGIFPAYHMNKYHWITVLLDGTVEPTMLKWLVEMSHKNTKGL